MTRQVLIAIPTEGDRGKRDRVSGIFAKAPFFTFVKVSDNRIGEISVQENEASKFTQGAGPIVMKNLKDLGVDVILAGEVGPGAKTLMEISDISFWTTEADTKVSEAVSQYIESKT